MNDPWLLLGDFNKVLFLSEVRGGHYVRSYAAKFSEVLDQCGLSDLGAKGNAFTWYRRASGERPVAKRLDRALADCDWRTEFSEAYVDNLTRLHSDHCSLLLKCRGVVPPKAQHRFRFQAAWLTDKEFPYVVNSAWRKIEHMVHCSLEQLNMML